LTPSTRPAEGVDHARPPGARARHRRFCFLLGTGASVGSKIPTGGQLVSRSHRHRLRRQRRRAGPRRRRSRRWWRGTAARWCGRSHLLSRQPIH